MRVMIDTNILISAALFPKGRAAAAFFKALVPPYQPVVCDYVLDELHRKLRKSFLIGLWSWRPFSIPLSPPLWSSPRRKRRQRRRVCFGTRRTVLSFAPRSMPARTFFLPEIRIFWSPLWPIPASSAYRLFWKCDLDISAPLPVSGQGG